MRRLPSRLAAVVSARLRRGGIEEAVIGAEIKAMQPVAVGGTVDRSVLGILVDFTRSVPVEAGHWDETSLETVEDRLAETPCYASGPDGRVIFPDRKAPEALRAKWA